MQIALGRETEWLAGPIVDPNYRPFSADDLFEPSWVSREAPSAAPLLAGPIYRLLGRAGAAIVHLRSFLGRCARIEHERRGAHPPARETRHS